jgi:hypothetical protein
MPVNAGVLPLSRVTTPEQMDLWMTAPADEALSVQRPAPKETLRIVAQGEKKDANARNKIQLSWSPRLTGSSNQSPAGSGCSRDCWPCAAPSPDIRRA